MDYSKRQGHHLLVHSRASGLWSMFAEDVPFVVAIVELEEGARMMSRIVDAPRERITVGAAVKV